MNLKPVATILLGLVLCAPVLAQQQTTAPNYCADLSDFATRSACSSFNDLVASGDPDFVDLGKVPQRTPLRRNGRGITFGSPSTYACFETGGAFFTLSFRLPTESHWFSTITKGNYKTQEQSGPLSLYKSYRSGVSENYHSIHYKWRRFCTEGECDDPDIVLLNVHKIKHPDWLELSDAEIVFSYEYETVRGKIATRSLTIRRSTLAFADEVQIPDPKDPSVRTETGQCYGFNADSH